MIKLILLTGFLGTGKTTLLQAVLDAYRSEKIGVIVNEFGEVNIDALLVKREGIEMAELSNGSIFCACIKDHFVSSLIAMSGQDISYLFIEASGLADPASMGQILNSLAAQLRTPYDYGGSICVVDAESYMELAELLPALENQVIYSSALLINKADLVASRRLQEVSEALYELNPGAVQYVTTYCQTDMKALVGTLIPAERMAAESTNTVESRPKTFILKSIEAVDRSALLRLLRGLAPQAYRMKGFVKTDDGVVQVSAVREHISIEPWNNPVSAMELVIISEVGIRMVSQIAAGLEDEMVKGKLVL